MMDWMIYLTVFAAFFIGAFYSLSSVDFSKFCKVQNTQKIYLLLFLLSLALAWACTEAVMSLTLRRGY